MIEMVYHLKLNAALGPELKFLGATLNAHGVNSWFGCGLRHAHRAWACSR